MTLADLLQGEFVSGHAAELSDRLHDSAPLTWSFIGDSVTAGGWHTFGHRSYAELLHERLRELGRTSDAVINTSVSGWQVDNLRQNLDDISLRFAPDIVVIGIGFNDTKNGEAGVSAFKDDYREIVGRLRSAGASHILSQTPNETLPTAPRHIVEYLPAYAEATRELAAELGTILIDHHAAWRSAGVDSMFHWLGHGCHPNAAGHLALARGIMHVIGVWDPDTSRTCRLSIP